MCPDIDVLRELIQGTLPEDDEVAATTHLDECPGCQYRIDQLAGPEDFIDRVPRMLGDSGEMTVLDAALDELEGETSRGLPQYPDPERCELHAVGTLPHDTHDDFSPYGDVERWFGPSDEPGVLGMLAGYDVIDFIGRGGMGVVFRGRDRSLGREVAIKVLAPSLAANATARERFFREARSAAAINHTNVATVHSVEESAQLPCLVMEYVAGESLRQRLDQVGRLELKEIIRTGYQVASGLDAAHTKGIVHRDIKPGNILLESSTRRVRLTDFGLARVIADESLTQTGLLVGTPGYIAPEVASGEEADHRADLFSLGCLLYVMATGELPFRADSTMQSLRRVIEDEATPPCRLTPELPAWLNELITLLLQKSPDDRPQTAAEVQRVLKRRYRELNNRSADSDAAFNDRTPVSPSGEPDSISANSAEEPTTALPEVRPRTLLPIGYAGAGAALLAIALGIGMWLGGGAETDDSNAATHTPPPSPVSARPSETVPSSELDEAVTGPHNDPVMIPGNQFAVAVPQVTPLDPLPIESDEAAEPPGRDALEPAELNRGEQYVVLDDDEFVARFNALEDAIRAADDGHTIVIHDDGPIQISRIEIHQDELTIAAAPGVQPVLELTAEDGELSGELFAVMGSVQLQGLELRIAASDGESDAGQVSDDDEEEDFRLVRCRGAMRAINCRFVQQRAGRCIAAENAEYIELQNCELHAPRGSVVSWDIDDRGELHVHNCIMTAETALCFDGDARGFELELTETTILAGSAIWLNLKRIRLDDDEPGFHVQAEHTVFDVDDANVVLEPEFGDARVLFQQTHWNGEHNVFTGPFAAVCGEDGFESSDEIPKTVRHWAELENVEEHESIQHSVEYAAGREELLLIVKIPQDSPARFQILEQTVLAERLQGIPGANVDEIGTGLPYEHWLRERDE